MYSKSLFLLGLFPQLLSAAALKARQAVSCQLSFAANVGDTCDSFAASWGLTLAGFQALNPTISCPTTLVAGQNYCAIGTVSAVSTTSTTSPSTATSSSTSSGPLSTTTSSATSSSILLPSSSVTSTTTSLSTTLTTYTTLTTSTTLTTQTTSTTSTTSAAPTTSITLTTSTARSSTSTTTTTSMTQTVGSNGIATPLPTQAGIVSNCNNFVLVNPGDTCNVVAFFNGPISTENFVLWNGGVGGMACTSLQAGTYACIGVTGTVTATTMTTSTAVVGPNGIATPTPTQSGMVSNCNKFVLVNPGDTCNIVAFYNGPISTENFVLWNGGVGGTACTNLQAGTYACIGVTGTVTATPTPTPTAVVGPNGIATPTPTQSGMVSNCNKFVKVNPGDTCNIVAFYNGPISTENFVLWNGGVGGMACTSLQAGTFACIGVV